MFSILKSIDSHILPVFLFVSGGEGKLHSHYSQIEAEVPPYPLKIQHLYDCN